MNLECLTLVMACTLVSAACADQPVISVWPEGKIPLKTSDAPEKVNPSTDDIVRLTDVNVPSLTVFLAKDTGKLNPAVMICPGGGVQHSRVEPRRHRGRRVAQ